MNIIKEVILFIKNIFIKQDEIKKLEEPKIIVREDNKVSFMESLKVTNVDGRIKKRIETLVCEGDGLGIQKKITY